MPPLQQKAVASGYTQHAAVSVVAIRAQETPLTVKVVGCLGGDVRPVRLVLGVGGGLTLDCSVGCLPDRQGLCRASPPEDRRRDLIGAWLLPCVRVVRRRSAS